MFFLEDLGMYGSGSIILIFMLITILHNVVPKKEKHFFKFKSALYYITPKENNIDNAISRCFFIVIINIMIATIVIIADILYVGYCESILIQIQSIEGFIIAYFGVVVSVIIFSVTLGPKEYYLTVSRAEINRHYHIDVIYQLMGICVTGSILCTICLQDAIIWTGIYLAIFVMYQFCCLYILIGGIYALIVVGMLTLGKERMELYSLNNLYTIFWNNSFLKLVNKTEDVVYENLGYLINNYLNLKVVRTSSIYEIKYIEYVDDITGYKKWYAKAAKIILQVTGILSVISILFNVIGSNWLKLIVTVILYSVCLILIKPPSFLREYVIALVLDRKGFIINFENDEKFIGNVSIYYNVYYQKYIRSLQNMMAFYCIICSCWDDETSNIIVESMEEMILRLKEYDNELIGYRKAMLYLPVFLCGFFYYTNFTKESFPQFIVDLFEEINMKEAEKELYKKTMNSFIIFACQYRPTTKDKEVAKSGNWKSNYYEKYIENNEYWQLINKKTSEKKKGKK